MKDTQNEPDLRRIPIDRVGIKDLRYPIRVKDKSGEIQSTIATVALTVDLPHHFKGTHMSRFVEVLHGHGPALEVGNIHEVLHHLLNKLSSETAHLDLEFPYFIEKKAPVSGASSLMDYLVRFEASLSRSPENGVTQDLLVSVKTPVTTLCPCSKAISKYGAHNQRGLVTYSVRFHQPMWIEDMIARVEKSASSELYSLLKRPDEKAVTERAYENPVFVEDLVRNIADLSNKDPNLIYYAVEAENYESIHNHNAFARIEKSAPARAHD